MPHRSRGSQRVTPSWLAHTLTCIVVQILLEIGCASLLRAKATCEASITNKLIFMDDFGAAKVRGTPSIERARHTTEVRTYAGRHVERRTFSIFRMACLVRGQCRQSS
jgi:hypothetical protein